MPQDISYSKKNERKVCDLVEDYGLISVIIPVYNVEKYLKQCVDSVLAQTYQNIEIILVDDGSTDSSGQICDEYSNQHKSIKSLHEQNGGASSARNYGLKHAKGDYVYFLDSDDYLINNAIERMVVCAVNNQADLVFIEAKSIDESGKEIKSNYHYHTQYIPQSPYEAMQMMMDFKEFHVGSPFFFIKRKLFIENNLTFTEGIMYEDMIMSYQLFSLAQRCAHVHEPIYIRRYRPNSVMTSAKTEKNYVSAATVYREVSTFMKTLPDDKQSPNHVIRCAYNVLNIYRQMPADVQKKYKEDYKDIIQDIVNKDAFGDKALKLDCKSHFLWGAYKLKQKILK